MRSALLAIPFLLWGCSVRAQTAFRVDPYPVFTTAGNVPIGSSAPILTVPGSTIKICTDSACSNRATTYIDPAATMPCPTTAQITLPGSTVCQSTTDNEGQFGFWILPGSYYYTVTLPPPIGGTMGPFPITTGIPGTSGVASFNSRTGVVVPLINDYTFSLIGGTKQGNTNVPQMAGTNSNTPGATLCDDASGNATTVGCTGGGVSSFNSRTGAVVPTTGDYTYSQIGGATQGNTTKPQMAGTNSGSTGALLCDDASGNATTTGCSSTAGVSSFNSRTGVVVPTTGDYTFSQIGGTKQGNTNVPQMAGTNSGTTGAILCNDANGNATTTGCSGAGASSPFTDATAILFKNADPTSLLKFNLGAFPTGTTYTLTPQNFNYTLAGIDISNTFAGSQTFTGTVSFSGASPAINLVGNMIPSSDDTRTLGDMTHDFTAAFIHTIYNYVPGTAFGIAATTSAAGIGIAVTTTTASDMVFYPNSTEAFRIKANKDLLISGGNVKFSNNSTQIGDGTNQPANTYSNVFTTANGADFGVFNETNMYYNVGGVNTIILGSGTGTGLFRSLMGTGTRSLCADPTGTLTVSGCGTSSGTVTTAFSGPTTLSTSYSAISSFLTLSPAGTWLVFGHAATYVDQLSTAATVALYKNGVDVGTRYGNVGLITSQTVTTLSAADQNWVVTSGGSDTVELFARKAINAGSSSTTDATITAIWIHP